MSQTSLNLLRIRENPIGYLAHAQQHLEVSGTLRPLALLAVQRGDAATAMERVHEALVIDRETLGDEHWKVGEGLWILGRAQLLDSDLVAAESTLGDAGALLRRALGEEHRLSALAAADLGSVLRRRGRPAEALALHQGALATLERVLPETHPDIADVVVELGRSVVANEEAGARRGDQSPESGVREPGG